MSSVSSSPPATGSPPLSVRILVADEDAERRSHLRRQLTEFGHAVVADVGTCAEAMSQAHTQAPEIAILCGNLPDASGFETAQRITQERPDLAVVLLSDDAEMVMCEQDLAKTTAMTLLPWQTPPRVMESTVRLAVFRARELHSAREEVTVLRQQLEARKAIERAKGILMRRTGLTEQEAYRILQRTSQDRSVPMAVVAKEVLDSEPGRT
jgi:AmiR/NasT family two-component response regulator